MPTPLKGYATPPTGTGAGTWGQDLNDNVMGIIDLNMAGIVVKSVFGSDITLTTDEAENCLIRLIGTQSANIAINNSNQGFYFVENLTTGIGTVTVTNGVAGVGVPRGTRAQIFADTTNGCRIVSQYLGFVSGTSQLFYNATVPTGWAKSTAVDNGTIQLVAGAGGVTGGTSNFTDVFKARTILQANIPNYNLPVTDPGHLHGGTRSTTTNADSGDRNVPNVNVGFGNTGQATTGISVNSGGSGTPMDFAVKYAAVILGVVN